MPAIDLTDPRVLNFYAENFEKEARSRVKWNEKNKETLGKAATLQRAPKNYTPTDSLAHKMRKGMAALTQDHKEYLRYRKAVQFLDASPRTTKDLKHGHSIVDLGLGDPKEDPRLARADTDPSPDPIMRPVDSTTAEVIYKPRPEFGRVSYLAKRFEKAPEDRYYLPECNSWDYGWRLKDSKQQKPVYGRYWHLMRALKNHSGAQPDPKHYGANRNIKAAVPCVEPSYSCGIYSSSIIES